MIQGSTMSMDTIRRRKLQKHREAIVQDLDVVEVYDHLKSVGMLTEDDISNIKSESVRKVQARHLLDLISSRGPEAYDSLVASLKPYYPWLADKLSSVLDCQASEEEERIFADALLLGGLPSPPQYNVVRENYLVDLRKQLSSMRRGQCVVLHGMAGSGKSCLAAQALNDRKLLMETFKGCVYWLSVGDVSGDDLLTPMIELLEKMSATSKKQFTYDEPTTVSKATSELRTAFTRDPFRNGLLVLDDVTLPALVEAFNIGCKVLVTTTDTNSVNAVRGRETYITLKHGFSKHESLTLLANCVGIPLDDLPHQATKIHELSKGVPLVLALIGAQLAENRDDARRNPGRWESYTLKLASKDYGNLQRGSRKLNQGGLLGAIRLSVDSLTDELRGYYQDFALFVEDVNIMPEVLETLWQISKYEVEDHMVELIKKSLAVSKWNEHLNSYVYGIHDLLLYYLKLQLTDEKKQDLHKKLLSRYQAVCGGKYADLPTNDNYIFSYLGYHLSQAQEWQTFKTLYFDLEFLGAKLKNSGLGDLLVDFRKYRPYITGGVASVEEILNDYEKFVQLHGLDLHRYKDLDVIQCALMQPRRSHVYKEAVRIADQQTSRLYLELLLELDHESSTHPSTLPLKNEVFAACFADTPNRVLVANGNGFINLWDVDYGRILYTFRGHRQPVVYLELCPDEQQFLSASEDGTVKLWSLQNIVCQDSSSQVYDQYGCALKTPSPRMRQNSWSNMHGNGDAKVDSSVYSLPHDASVRHATYSHDGTRIVSCANDLKIWECADGVLTLTVPTPDPTSTCAFSSDDSLVFVAVQSKGVAVHNANNGSFLFTLDNPDCIINILPIPDCDDRLVVTSRKSVQLWSLEDLSSTEICRCRDDGSYISSRLTQDGLRVVVGDSAHRINVWDVGGGSVTPVQQYQDHSGCVRCLDTYWLDLDGRHLVMSGSDDRTIKVWPLEARQQTNSPSKLKPQFHAVWPVDNPCSVPLLAALSATGVQVLCGRKLVMERTCDATVCQLSADGSRLAFGCTDGHVYLTELNARPDESKAILSLKGGVHYLQFLSQRDVCTLVAATDTMWQIWKEGVGCVLTASLNNLVQCFATSHQKLLTCSQDGSIKVWHMEDAGSLLLGGNPSVHITATALSPTEDLLALTDATGQLHLVTLDASHTTTTAMQSFKLGDAPMRSCGFTVDARALAIGHDSGIITIWDMQTRTSLASLTLHKSWVRSLLFSASHPGVLVSVGDVVGVWDLSAVYAARRRRKSGNRYNRLSLETVQGADDIWCTKRGRAIKPELLGCVKLSGSHADRMYAAADFSVLTTVDSAGTVYHLKPFRGSQHKAINANPFRFHTRLRNRLSD